MSEWKEINLLEIAGESTNPFHQNVKFAEKLLNVHLHDEPGAVTLRPGYRLKYKAPNEPTMEGEFLSYGVFYDKKSQKEVVCLISKGEISALSGSNVTDTIKGLWFFTNPNIKNGTVYKYNWVNKTIITKITVGSDATYPNMIKIFNDGTIKRNTLNRFTIYNKTQNQYAQIITSKLDGSDIRIVHTRFNSSWNIDDVIIISRYRIDFASQTALYNTKPKDVSYHNILSDLRIGFGGKAGRDAVAVGYREKYFQIGKYDFAQHPDIVNTEENFSYQNDIVFDTTILSKDGYGIEISTSDGGKLGEGIYYIRLSGIIDSYAEQLLAETSVVVGQNSKISINPYIKLGEYNPRITGFKVYYGQKDGFGNIAYYKIKEFDVMKDKYHAGKWKVDKDSRLYITDEVIELHAEHNVLSIDNELNNLGSWSSFRSGLIAIHNNTSSEESPGYVFDSAYSIKFTDFVDLQDRELGGLKFPVSDIEKGNYYDIEFNIKSSTYNKTIDVFFVGASGSGIGRTSKTIDIESDKFYKVKVSLLADKIKEAITHIVIATKTIRGRELCFTSDSKFIVNKENGANTFESYDLPGGVRKFDKIITIGDKIIAMGWSSIEVDNILFVSYDGKSFEKLGDASKVNALYQYKNEIYYGTGDGKIYKSENKGKSFELFADNIPLNYPIHNISRNSNYIFVSIIPVGISGSIIYRSNDEGKNWVNIYTNNTHDRVLVESTEIHIYISTVDGSGFYFGVSADNGETWVNRTAGLSGSAPTQILLNKSNVYLTTKGGGGIFKTIDDGVTWTDISGGDAAFGFTSGVVKRNDTLFVIANKESLFYSTNEGGSWTENANYPGLPLSMAVNDNTFLVDKFSLKTTDTTIFTDTKIATTEMGTEFGYTPNFNLVKGWDDAVVSRGRVYYLNPFVEKRYENFLLVSHISGSGSYMWDVASFFNYRELERFDGSIAMGMMILPTTEIIVIKTRSVEILSDDGLVGILREPIENVTCVSRQTIVDLSGLIIWAGEEELYSYSSNKGLGVHLRETIRDKYLKIINKEGLSAIRDKFNTYRLLLDDSNNKTEYLFFEGFNVVEELKNLPPEQYQWLEGDVSFLNQGNIYEVENINEVPGYGSHTGTKYGTHL